MVQKQDKSKDRTKNERNKFKDKKTNSKFMKPNKSKREMEEEYYLEIPEMVRWAGYDEY